MTASSPIPAVASPGGRPAISAASVAGRQNLFGPHVSRRVVPAAPTTGIEPPWSWFATRLAGVRAESPATLSASAVPLSASGFGPASRRAFGTYSSLTLARPSGLATFPFPRRRCALPASSRATSPSIVHPKLNCSPYIRHLIAPLVLDLLSTERMDGMSTNKGQKRHVGDNV